MGELAALGTAFCWSFSSIFFTAGSKRVGSLVVNRARLVAAVLLVGLAHRVLLGRFFPFDAEPQRIVWFTLSALVGLVLGDTLLFQSYIFVGTRIGMLLMSLNPIFGALLAWPLLGETLSLPEVAAMMLALAGATWVVLERGAPKNGAVPADRRRYALGATLAVAAGLCQALGLIIAKRGLAGDFAPLSAVIIRMSSAMIVMWGLAAAQGQVTTTIHTLRKDHRAELAILGGAIAGPFLGVWLSMVAVQNARVGIASTLMAMTPIMLLPLVRLIYREHVSARAAAGTLLAVAGVAIMFFV